MDLSPPRPTTKETKTRSKSRFPSAKLEEAKLKTCSRCLLIRTETVIQGRGTEAKCARGPETGGLRPGPFGTPAWNHLPAGPTEKK